MDDLSEPPYSLLYRLAVGQIADDDLEAMEAMLSASGLVDPPPWLQARASRLATPQREPVPQAPAWRERLRTVAQLVFDSWTVPHPAPLRGPGGTPRQLLLHADGLDISLHVQASTGEGLLLIGQLLSPESLPGEVLLLPSPSGGRGGEPAQVPHGPVPLDALGEFLFERIAPGRYSLSVRLELAVLDSVELDLGDDPGALPGDIGG